MVSIPCHWKNRGKWRGLLQAPIIRSLNWPTSVSRTPSVLLSLPRNCHCIHPRRTLHFCIRSPLLAPAWGHYCSNCLPAFCITVPSHPRSFPQCQNCYDFSHVSFLLPPHYSAPLIAKLLERVAYTCFPHSLSQSSLELTPIRLISTTFLKQLVEVTLTARLVNSMVSIHSLPY